MYNLSRSRCSALQHGSTQQAFVNSPHHSPVQELRPPWICVPRGPKVVPFWGSYIESYKLTPKRNYFGASGRVWSSVLGALGFGSRIRELFSVVREFPKIRAPYFGVLIIRILPFRVLY